MARYNGKHIIKGYQKHFGVDVECAICELRLLGVQLDREYVTQLIESNKARLEQKARRKAAKELVFLNDEFILWDDADDWAFLMH